MTIPISFSPSLYSVNTKFGNSLAPSPLAKPSIFQLNKPPEITKPNEPSVQKQPKITTPYHGKGIFFPHILRVNQSALAEMSQYLLYNHLTQGTDPANLKLFIGEVANMTSLGHYAMADSLRLINKPVDIILKSSTDKEGLMLALSATGHRLMYPGAEFDLTPKLMLVEGQANRESQIMRMVRNDVGKALETLIMDKTGETDRKKVHQQLNEVTRFNALQSLAYGKKGLVEGILVGQNQVITRAHLDQYIQDRGLDEKQTKAFLADINNVSKIKPAAVENIFPNFLPKNPNALYQSFAKNQPDLSGALGALNIPIPFTKPANTESTKNAEPQKESPISVLTEMVKINKHPNFTKVRGKAVLDHYQLENKGQKTDSVLFGDTIYFMDSFRFKSGEKVTEALLHLEDKYNGEPVPKHIKMMLHSPGGSVTEYKSIKSTIQNLNIPVDVIATGFAASAGGMTLATATGKRFATPNSLLMLHEASSGFIAQGNNYNLYVDSLKDVSKEMAEEVSRSTGRPLPEVLKDFSVDYFMNPLEALFYGDKGLIDAVLVGPNEVITKREVQDYLLEKLGSREKVDSYVQKKLEDRRDPLKQANWRPEEHDENDPFLNPARTIEIVAKRAAKKMSDLPEYQRSTGQGTGTIDIYNVVPPPPLPSFLKFLLPSPR